MDKVRLAIIGCGTISQLNVPGYLMHDGCEITALCDPIRERAVESARRWGISPKIHTRYEDVLNDADVDAVELLTPTFMHPEQAIAGLRAGKHVSCQKPVAGTVAEADQIAEAASNSGTTFRVTENFLYYPPIVKAKELLDAGAIGDPSMVRVRTVRGKLPPDHTFHIGADALEWRKDPNVNAGGLLYDDGHHKYATAMWWLGDVEKIQSIVTETEDVVLEAPSAVIWKYKDRDCLAVFDYSASLEMPLRTRYYPGDEFFEIQGSKGAIWVTRCTGEWLDMPPVMLVKGSTTESFQVPMDWIEGFNGAAKDFVDSILNDSQPKMDIQFSKRVLQASLAIYEASKTEHAVKPDSLT